MCVNNNMDMNSQNKHLLLPTTESRNMDQVLSLHWKRSLRMRVFYNRRCLRRILFGTLAVLLFLFCFVFVVVPFIFRYSYNLQRSLLFLNFVNNRTELKAPWKHGLLGSRNFYLSSEDGVEVGVWHILPSSRLPSLVVDTGILNRGVKEQLYDRYLANGEPIFIYHHGNAGNRGARHRVELYKVLQKNNYHVIAFDYRSYGDSSAVEPDEFGVVADAKAVYRWTKRMAPNSSIYLWGHSLGTGVASHSIYDLELEGAELNGLILEAPFTNLQEEIRDYPMSRVFRPLPWFDYFFVTPTYENGLRFESDVYLVNVTAPIMILHAEDDVVVPFHLGKKLYNMIKTARGDEGKLVRFVKYDKSLGHGHDHIYSDESISRTISDFILAVSGGKKKTG